MLNDSVVLARQLSILLYYSSTTLAFNACDFKNAGEL
jgi:hypothetical protein